MKTNFFGDLHTKKNTDKASNNGMSITEDNTFSHHNTMFTLQSDKSSSQSNSPYKLLKSANLNNNRDRMIQQITNKL